MASKRILAWLMPTQWADRIQIWLSLILQLLIAALFFGALFENQWLLAFTALIVLTLTFLPAIIERQINVRLPVEFTFITCLFLYATFGLGEVRDFYLRYWWWDLLLHSCSALVIGIIGFLWVYVFYSTRKIIMAPVYIALFSFCFAVAVGTVWELFEFGMDWFFGFNMQKSGLVDTMTDLSVDCVGAIGAAWVGYHYVKDGDSLIAERLIQGLVDKNPHLLGSLMRSNDKPKP